MVPFNANSDNYDDYLQAAADEISAETEKATEKFASIRNQLESILMQLEAWESDRSEFIQREQIEDYAHPEVLEDFDFASDAAVEDLYTAWDEFTEAESVFNEDTTLIKKLKTRIGDAINIDLGEFE